MPDGPTAVASEPGLCSSSVGCRSLKASWLPKLPGFQFRDHRYVRSTELRLNGLAVQNRIAR